MSRPNPCQGKRRYRTGGQARAALDTIRRRGAKDTDRKPARA